MDERASREFRSFLEEICAQLCRLVHVHEEGARPESITIRREAPIGRNRFADLLVEPPSGRPYLVEVKNGLATAELIERLRRKLGQSPGVGIEKLVLVVDTSQRADWRETQQRIRDAVDPSLTVEIWNEERLTALMEKHFGLRGLQLTGADLLKVRAETTRGEWEWAFGESGNGHDRLRETLLWHFSPWTLRRLKEERGMSPEEILKPGLYRRVVILTADLSSFSAYVRDTRDDDLVRRILTRFYSEARAIVHEAGGMLEKFVGDEVIGLFGFPAVLEPPARQAVECAERLIEVGRATMGDWQRRIDRAQKSQGLHVGIAMGDLNVMPGRALSRHHLCFIGDAFNIAARLLAEAGPGEIVVSNSVLQQLPPPIQSRFGLAQEVEAKNVGVIRCWKKPAE